MKNRVFALLLLFGCALATACRAEAPQSNVELHYYKEGYQDICNEILKKNQNNSLEDIQVGSVKENFDKSFFADFDNDGIDEEFKFKILRNYAALGQIIDGERIASFSMDTGGDTRYRGNRIIKIDNEFFMLHMATFGPFGLQRYIEITPEEKKKRNMDPGVERPRYDIELLCKFY